MATRCPKPTSARLQIEMDDNNQLIGAEMDANVVCTLQLTLTPSMSFQGGKRATVESVRGDKSVRSKGIGRKMMQWTIELAKSKGCISMQLTTNADSADAHRLYERLGFKSSHFG